MLLERAPRRPHHPRLVYMLAEDRPTLGCWTHAARRPEAFLDTAAARGLLLHRLRAEGRAGERGAPARGAAAAGHRGQALPRRDQAPAGHPRRAGADEVRHLRAAGGQQSRHRLPQPLGRARAEGLGRDRPHPLGSRARGHRAGELQAVREIRERNRLAALGEMAAGLAHEIRNPLGAIKGAAQCLEFKAAAGRGRRVPRRHRRGGEPAQRRGGATSTTRARSSRSSGPRSTRW